MVNDKSINIPNLHEEDNLTAQTLGTNGDSLFAMGSTSENKSITEVSDDLEECFRSVEVKVMKWESSRTKIRDSGDLAVAEYLQAISEASKLSENLVIHVENEGGENKDDELLHRVEVLLRIAMVKLEEEFTHILVRQNRPFEPECISFHSSDICTMDGISICSFECDKNLVDESSSQYSSTSTYSGELVIDLVHQYTIPSYKKTHQFTAYFDQECCDAYTGVRKDALAGCFFMLEVDNLSIDVGVVALTAQNNSFPIKNRKWNQAMKNFTSVYLASEKVICDRVFGEIRSASSTCFTKIFEVPMLQLLKCGEAIMDIGGREPERVFLKLDMYEVLLNLLPDIDKMFPKEAGFSVRFAFREMLKTSGDCVKGTILEFERAVRSSVFTKPFAGGGVCRLSKYVMNYIVELVRDHCDTLCMLLEVSHGADLLEEKENEGGSSSNVHPLAYHKD